MLRDDEGRPLTEMADRLDVDEEVACPYSGPRRGLPMNRAALAQVGRYWPRLLREVRVRMPREGRLQQAFQMCLECVCAPLLCSGAVPAYVAVRYKACVGFCQVFAWLLLEQGDQRLEEMGSGAEFLAWMEAGEWLRGSRQVCAGSGHQIATLFEAFCQGEGGALGRSPVLEVVGLQAALALRTYERLVDEPADRSLGCRLLAEGRAPWLFAATSRPGGSADLALRFFAGEKAGPGVTRFLASGPLVHGEREQLFWSCALECEAGWGVARVE